MNIQEKYYFSLPINHEHHKTARFFAEQQNTKEKGEKVYLNTLAVCAIKDFLEEELSFDTVLNNSDSWNPILRAFQDVADLVLPDLGRVECLSIIEDTDSIPIPQEVREDRVAYIVVKFPEVLNKVQLLGFYPCPDRILNSKTIKISELEEIEYLIDYFFSLELEREKIEMGINCLKDGLENDDEVAIRLKQRLNSQSYEEISNQLIRIVQKVPQEDQAYKVEEILNKNKDLVSLDRTREDVANTREIDDEELDLFLDIFYEFKNLCSDDELN